MPPKQKRQKKQKPFEKLQDFIILYNNTCAMYDVQPLPEVEELYKPFIEKKAKKTPQMIQFSDTVVPPTNIRPLVEAFQKGDVRIKILSFLNTQSGDDGLHALAHSLSPPLEIVGIAYHANGVGPSGCRGFARSMVNSKFLTILELDFNPQIGDEGIIGLTSYGHCQSLNRLSLSFCNIGDKGAECLAKWISLPDCSIKELILNGNQIGPIGAAAIGLALPSNKSLNRLDLGDNIFGYDTNALEGLYEGIKECEPLSSVSLLNHFECPPSLYEKFLQLTVEKPLGEFELTVKMHDYFFQKIRATAMANKRKLAQKKKRRPSDGAEPQAASPPAIPVKETPPTENKTE